MLIPREVTCLPRQSTLVPSQDRMQAMHAVNPRQLVALLPRQEALPQPGRNSGSASPQASSSSPPRQVALPRQAPPQSSRNSPPSQRGENTLQDSRLKWVINLSSKPLTRAQRSLLAKKPNFVVTPRHPPNLKYITAIESVCTKLGQLEVKELWAYINMVLRSSPKNLI